MLERSRKQKGRLFLGTEFFSIGEDFLETENDRRIGNMIKLTATLYMCNTKEFSELIGDLGHGTFESMWEWYTENVTNKVKNPDIKFGNTGLIRQKYSNIDNVEDEIKKLYDGLPPIPFNNLQGFVSNTTISVTQNWMPSTELIGDGSPGGNVVTIIQNMGIRRSR